MSASYKIALVIAAALVVVVIVYFATQNNPTTTPVTEGEGAVAERTPPETGTRPTLRDDARATANTTADTGKSVATADTSTPTEPTANLDLMERIRQQRRESEGLAGPVATNDTPVVNTDGTQPDTGANVDLLERIRQQRLEAEALAEAQRESEPDTLAGDGTATSTDTTPEPDRGTLTPDMSPEVNPDIAPDTTPERTPDVAPDTTITRDDRTTATLAATPTIYKVEAGDNMFKISEKVFGTDRYWQAIAQENPFVDPTRLRVGQELRLPAREDVVEPEPQDAVRAPANTVVHTVKPTETLSSIASQYYGNNANWRLIYNYNRDVIGTNPDRLKVGMKLSIPPALPE